ncbi:hypothetical protein BCR37DRAFT_256822 [Protomyces lactucae-debilis]|uniref:EF-hand domain-containing protein n=1 Tax=Protomyces lactucae-debilis TaxID=2754530 RepID=A0A1Y2FM13_PROLT|nr:uncharacterized protein BCR37DRAFT_256822 [Protomyces lactucae-debilis]ORY85010.1 hypothetical protein BCR37DRAFT_256822 [Protomyces lactucae-debilis]
MSFSVDLEKDLAGMRSRRGSVTDLLKSRRLSRMTLLVFALITMSFYSWQTYLYCYSDVFLDEYESLDGQGLYPDQMPDDLPDCLSVKDYAAQLPEVDWFEVAQLGADEQLFDWTDDWISHGILPAGLQLPTPRFDLVYTWANGSAADFQAHKAPYDEVYATLHQDRLPEWQLAQGSRHRSWDELRYSIRSAVRFAPTWLSRILIVSKRLRSMETGETYVQQPEWLDATVSDAEVQVEVVADEDIMDHPQCAPTFNSVSVESQLSHLNTTPFFVALSDDMFFGTPVASSDFQSDLYGMTLNNYNDILHFDQAYEPVLDESMGGEILVAQYTSYMLNQRFGRRMRPIQQHHQKIISRSIMNQAMSTFPRAGTLTPLSRQRYDSHQLYGWYMHNQFTIEMHREAMLWSILWRMDRDEDGYLSMDEAQAFLAEIEAGKQAQRRSLSWETQAWATQHADENLEKAGLPAVKAQGLLWSSMDGPFHLLTIDASVCSATYTHLTCLGFDADRLARISLEQVMKNLRNVTVTCGDCLIRYLLDNAEHGLDVILPRKAETGTPSKYRQMALRALKKYAYTTARPDGSFYMVHNALEANNLYAIRVAAFTCINDDFLSDDEQEIHEAFKGFAAFFQGLFPTQLKIERVSPVSAIPLEEEVLELQGTDISATHTST